MASTLFWILGLFCLFCAGLVVLLNFPAVLNGLKKASCALEPGIERCKGINLREKYMGKVIFLVGLSLSSLIGLIFGWMIEAKLGGFFFGLIVWLGAYVHFGLMIVPHNEVWAIERLGEFDCFIRAGWHLRCFKGLIDKIKKKIPLSEQETALYADAPGQLVEFKDRVSAFVRAFTWWRVEPDDASLMKFTYNIGDVKEWLMQLFDSVINPALEAEEYESVRTERGRVAANLLPNLDKEAKEKSGVGITKVRLEGFELTDESREARDKVYQAKKSAEQAIFEGEKVANAIEAIMKKSGKGYKEAEHLYLQNKALDTLKSTGANVTLVAPDMHGAVKTLDINPPKSKGNK